MEIIVFILLAGVWAAFLLPSFFDHRRQTPRATTRDFARSKQLLASVSSASYDEHYTRRHQMARRRQLMFILALGAVATLIVATITGSMIWLGVTVAFDVAIAAYVTTLLLLRQQQWVRDSRSVLQIPVAYEPAPEPDVEIFQETPTVRVIAG